MGSLHAEGAKVSFVRDVMPILNKASCTAGTCHGAAKGKNGFKLSLRGYDPEFDYRALISDLSGRRFNRVDPGRSLMLLKPTAQLPHGGGLRFDVDSPYYKTIYQWISEGSDFGDPVSAQVTKLDIEPLELVAGIFAGLASGEPAPYAFIADTLENGAGFSTHLGQEEILRELLVDVHQYLERLARNDHAGLCTASCYRCLRDYGNMSYHALLDWRLAAFSLFLLPFFVWLTRRVGEERRRIQSVRQSRLADMSTLVEESLSVSGILLGKTMGRSPELVRRFSGESGELADLEVRARMAGRWRMASVQMSFAIMPALVYLFAGVDHGSAE